MSKTPENFFRDLPARKAIVLTGYCEPVEGDPHNSVVVHLDTDCLMCSFLSCHMFSAVQDESGKIIGRQFVAHEPEY